MISAYSRMKSSYLKEPVSFDLNASQNYWSVKVHETVLEINLTHLTQNLKVYQQMLKPETKMMVMVKAFGYGSGSSEIANVLQFNNVDYLAVAYADEGVELRESRY